MLNAHQQQKRSHHTPIEEVFTEHDVNWNFNYNTSTGFNFDYPRRWLDSFSYRKTIRVRRLNLNPSSHKFDLRFMMMKDMSPTFTKNSWIILKEETVYSKPTIWEPGIHEFGPIFVYSDERVQKEFYEEIEFYDTMYMIRYECSVRNGGYHFIISTKDSDETIETKMFGIYNKRYTILEENEMAEIMYKIIYDANIVLENDLKFQYDAQKCILKIESDMLFSLFPVYHNKNMIGEDVSYFDPHLIEFLKFLNQPITMKNYFDLIVPRKELNYNNVWSRRQAYIHSTFSDTKRGYIGLRNDFWSSPTKSYVYSNGGQEFYIRFTTDGVNPFIPLYSGFIIELVFVVDEDKVDTLN